MDISVCADPRRAAVIEEAQRWLLTPYHHMGRVRGAGADCLTLLAEVYERAGIVGHIELPFYPPDWHFHRDAERYLDGVMKYAREIEGPPMPGDIALFKFARCFAHGAIVVEWPSRIIHTWSGQHVQWGSATDGRFTVSGLPRATRFFNPF